ncbi:Glutathione S-transferase theta-3 [Eumeta japonica]|uniref:Glutathione S-transferase theta-3 n=1 Tax=Eumeta variegata TaxID=151549 RepID=A0A4C1Z6K6_EUMVA|nr:Glutathione S-transferase theta-3 [Eumeta japonica]
MGRQPDPKQVAGYEGRMINCLDLFETKWLSQGYLFLTGDNITVADLWAACEIEQPRMAGFDATLKYPNIAAWMQRVKAYFNPYYEEGHVIVNKIIKNNEEKQKQAKSKL